MEPVGFAAGGSGSVSAGLGTRSGVKNKRSVGPQSRGASYKKPKKPVAVDGLVESSAGVSNVMDESGDGPNIGRSWASEVNSEVDSVSGVSDLDNLENVVAEETSYAESDVSGLDDDMNDATPRKTRTRTYVLNSKPPPLSFNVLSDGEDTLPLPNPKFCGSNRLPPVGSRAPEKRSFISSKSFALDIELSAVPGKTIGDKLARKMAISEKILVNDDLRKVNSHLDWEIIVKEIPVDFPKSAIEAVFSKFGKIVSIKVQFIGLWQKVLVEYELFEMTDLDSVHVAKANIDKQTWVSRDQHWALLYTLSVGTNAHDLFSLLESYGEKICYISCNPSSYVCDRCAVICFGDEASKLATIGIISVLRNVSLRWAGFSLASCACCKQFSHVLVNCSLASVARPVSFGGKTWAQVAGRSPSCVVSSGAPGVSLVSGLKAFSMDSSSSGAADLGGCLAVLKCSVEILMDQVLLILKKLSFVDLVLLASSLSAFPLVFPTAIVLDMDLGLDLDSMLLSSASFSLNVGGSVVDFSPSSSKIGSSAFWIGFVGFFSISMSSLVWKFATCNVWGINVPVKQADVVRWHVSSGNMVSFITETKLRSFSGPWIKDKFDGVRIFFSGLDKSFIGAGIAIVMNTSLARHVSKVEEIPGWVISVQLLFKGKLLVTVLGLYAGASSGARFGQASEVNTLIAKAVNSSNFVILDGDLNENGSGRSASFKFCLSLGLVNSFFGHHLANSYTWSNSREVGKTIDYIFVGSNLSTAVAGHQVVSVLDFFDTDHKAVVVSVGLGGLLDVQLNSLCKQVNKNRWKFKIKNADCVGWAKFKDLLSAKLLSLGEVFSGAEIRGNVDAMWAVLVEAVVNFADVTFSRHWFSEFKCSRNKHSSRFFGLEFKWSTLDNAKAHAFKDLVGSGVKSDVVVRHLSLVCRDYRRSKMFESRLAEEASVRKVIEKRMDNFCSDKNSMIRSVLEKPFRKVVLNHLIVDDDLVLLPEEVKSSVDGIMEGWTRKHSVQSVLPSLWAHQYMPLDYVRDDAFSGVMSAISMGAWVSMIPKPYDWDGVLMNTRSIALIETARKILSKILSDCILMACSKFNVLQGDNFLVLKGTSTQSPVFAVGSVIEDAIEKDRELWLVLQDMRKAYDSVGWHHLRVSLRRVKMCERFIRFFGGIHEDRINRVMTDFGLSDGYKMHDGLDQGKRIFYDPLLCEVKRHEQLCEYWINTKFVSKSGRIEGSGGLTSYFSAGVFASTQYALNIASEFFVINDISINSEKTVAIPINQGVKVASLNICGQPISIAKKEETHWYLGIFLSTEGLSKPSVAKAHADVHFFINVVLRKAITDKQFSYLVSAVLQPIVSYCTQFSFVSFNVCRKWDALVRKDLRFKTCLPRDFPDAVLHHLSLYSLKPFEQVQSEEKVLGWAPLDPLQFPVRLCINPVNNFLAGMVKIFLGNELTLVNNLPTAFRSPDRFLLSSVLEKSLYFDLVKSLKRFGVAFGDRLFNKKSVLLDWKTFCHWKRLDLRGLVPHWFMVSSEFLKGQGYSFSGSVGSAEKLGLDILGSGEFFAVKDGLHDIWSGFFEVFTDGSLRNAGSAEVACGAVAYFPVLDKSIGVAVRGLLSSTMAELQAVTLALECVPSSSTVVLCLDSQAAIDACVSEMSLVAPDFRNQCWLERHHIFNLVRDKDLSVSWVKVKGHSGIPGNVRADLAAGAVSGSSFSLCADVRKHFLVAEGVAVSDNARHFVRNIFQSICCARWEAGPGCDVVLDVMIGCIDWVVTAKVWHPDSHMLAGFTNCASLTLRTYVMKTVHRRLPVAVRKRLYDKCYPSVLCLFCGEVEFSDHIFTCVHESGIHGEILAEVSARWSALAGGSPASAVLQVLSQCSIDVGLYTLVCKGFVLEEWYEKACDVFEDRKVATARIVDYVKFVVGLHHTKVWLARANHQVVMEKAGLVCDVGVVSGLPCDVSSVLSDGVVRLLGLANSFAVSFGHRKPYCFFSGLGGSVRVVIDV
ncbi:hypothetical protein G9A89_018216 [Geosiphon pyriformis]|nr:hypothetical protein G9A89_018216 [Geosiphon pyriformis]